MGDGEGLNEASKTDVEVAIRMQRNDYEASQSREREEELKQKQMLRVSVANTHIIRNHRGASILKKRRGG